MTTKRDDVAELVNVYHDLDSNLAVLTFEKEKTCVELTVTVDNLVEEIHKTGWFSE